MRALTLVVVGAFLMSCGGAAQAPVPPPASAPAKASLVPTAGTPGPTATTAPATQAARPAFLGIRLTDVRSGEQFTLGGFQGKVVLGIAMAVW